MPSKCVLLSAASFSLFVLVEQSACPNSWSAGWVHPSSSPVPENQRAQHRHLCRVHTVTVISSFCHCSPSRRKSMRPAYQCTVPALSWVILTCSKHHHQFLF
ncbi:hypothetical protein HDV63DRAFT_385729 [Trichoderma sp. SZMC 28014]